MSLTKSQEKAINSNNSKILVSAGAGSGKTLVLSSRVKHLVENGNSIDNIVVLTFTKAAAAEMKQRIKRLLSESDNEFAKKMSESVEMAPITTLHGFASRMLKQYFYELEIDPAFTVLEDTEAKALKIEALVEVLQNEAQTKRDGFFDLADILFQNRRDENLRNIIFQIHDFLSSLPNPNEYVELAKNLYASEENSKKLIRFLIDEVSARAKFYLALLYNLMEECKQNNFKKFIDVLAELELNLLRIKPTNTVLQMQKACEEYSAPTKIMRGENAEKAEIIATFKQSIKKFFDSTGELFCVGAKEENDAENMQKANARIAELFVIYDKFVQEYTTRKNDLGVLDFSDLERGLYKLLQTASGEEIKQNIKYLFVDEYQDTNQLQQAIYERMDCKNYFFVGDVKQSIYGFRLAEPKIFINTRNNFRNNGGLVVNLNENFRSHEELIDFTNKLFSKIMTINLGGEDYLTEGLMRRGDAEINQKIENVLPLYNKTYPRVKMVAIKKAKATQSLTQNLPLYSVLEHKNEQDEKIGSAVAEGKALAKILKELASVRIFDAKLNRERDVESSDIAILTASRGEFLETTLKSAEAEGYSFSPDMTVNILDEPSINELVSLLKVVANPKQDIPLFVTLSGFWGNFSPDELATIKINSGKTNYFYDAVENFKNATNLTKEQQKIQTKLKKTYQFFEKLRFELQSKSVSELIDEIINLTDYDSYILEKKNGEHIILLLESLKEQLAKSKCNQNIDEFLWECENVGFFATETTPSTKGVAIYDDKGEAVRSFQNINVTTIHKSKGLEYPIVILVGAGRPFSREDLIKDVLLSKNYGMGISGFNTMQREKNNNIIKNAIRLDLQKQSLEEDIRLLYVGITRAVNHLIIIGVGDPTEPNVVGKNLLSSSNFYDLISKIFEDVPIPRYLSVSKESFELLSGQANKKLERVAAFPKNNDLVNEFVAAYKYNYPNESATKIGKKYSVSELSSREKIIDATSFSSESTSDIGNAYHHLMQHIDFAANTKEKFAEQKLQLLNNGYISSKELELIDDKKVLECLNSPLFMVLAKGKRKILREQQFLMRATAKELGLNSDCTDEVLVQGVFDVVVFDNDKILVVDYKTGGAKTDEELVKKHSTQMSLYKMAAEKAFSKPVHTAIYSFNMGKFIRVD